MGFFGPFSGPNAISIETAAPLVPVSSPEGVAGIAIPGAMNFPGRSGFGDGCMERIMGAMAYRTYRAVADGVTSPFIDSDRVKDGYYWYLLAASAHLLKNLGASNGAIMLMPPNFFGINGADPTGSLSFGGLFISNGTPGTGDSVGIQAAVPLQILQPILVPPGWFIRLQIFQTGANPAAGETFELRLALAELALSFDGVSAL